tara:strand:- start:673 stop:1011 length:339 start_codon:yes stop_codon:yes gene_type:complete
LTELAACCMINQLITTYIMQGSLPDRFALNIHDAACLAPFFRAQAPHSAIPTRQELRARGLQSKKREDSLKNVCDTFNAAYPGSLDFTIIEEARKRKAAEAKAEKEVACTKT